MRLWIPTGALLLTVLSYAGCASHERAPSHATATSGFCRPSEPCWPTPADWQQLNSRLGGKLQVPQSPVQPCRVDAAGDACAAAISELKNPFAIQDNPGGTQSLGWLDAWNAAQSTYAVAAENAQDIMASVDFARRHRLRLVIKGTGHDYLGRSSAPDSLLVWTHKMRKVTLQDAFVGRGCPASQAGMPAVTVEAGTRWLEVYQEVTGKHRRYVQGGGCTSVGAAGGFIQGGGFGSWSKKYGTAAAGMLEAEVVTADGKLLVANACQNQDLFWALRGGGGGTFGIVTKVTLRTHPLPAYFGFVLGRISARSDAAFQELLERFVGFYQEKLHNEQWGEQVQVNGSSSLQLTMSFHSMSAREAEDVWRPFLAALAQQPEKFTITIDYLEVPGEKMWHPSFLQQRLPSALVLDQRPEQLGELFWWAGNQGEVATYWYAYQSRWIPTGHFEPARAKTFAAALFEASRHWGLQLHFNKGLAGASSEAIERGRETSMNPAVYNAAALVIAAASGSGAPGVPGHEPNVAEGRARKARVTAAMKIIRDLTPGAGTYVNEADYFEPDWQQAFWGENYQKLLEIKRKYDPHGMFICHHCVGSEEKNDAFTRTH